MTGVSSSTGPTDITRSQTLLTGAIRSVFESPSSGWLRISSANIKEHDGTGALTLHRSLEAPQHLWAVYEEPATAPTGAFDNRILFSRTPFQWLYVQPAKFLNNSTHWFWSVVILVALGFASARVIKYYHATKQGWLENGPLLFIMAAAGFLVISPIIGFGYNHHAAESQIIRSHSIDSLRGLMPPREWIPRSVQDPVHWYQFMPLLQVIYFPIFITFVVSLLLCLIGLQRYFHYIFTTHPADRSVTEHIRGDEFDAEQFIEDLEPDVNLDDPAWKIRNRTQQAKDLSELYGENTRLGERALSHERKRRGRKS